jgi:hypothetical protein
MRDGLRSSEFVGNLAARLLGTWRPSSRRCPWFSAIVAIWLACWGAGAKADLQGDPRLLTLAANEHVANRDQIRTWRGRVRVFQTASISANASPDTCHAEVTFVIDRTKHAARSDWIEHESTRFTRSREGGTVEWEFHTMVLDGGYYTNEYAPQVFVADGEWAGRTTRLGGIAVVEPVTRRKGGPFKEDFDPMYWFTYSGGDVARLLESYVQWHREGTAFSRSTVTRSGDVVVLEAGKDSSPTKYSIDLRQGGNLIAFEQRHTQWKTSYEQVAGVWVPKRVVVTSATPGRMALSRTLQWIENVVNEPVSEKEFSLVKLGLRQGDRVQDNRTGISHTVEGDEYPPPEALEELPQPERRGRLFATVTGIGTLLLLLLLAWWVARRRRAK